MKNKTLLFTLNKKSHSKGNPDLLRITLFPDRTKIDFGYTAKEMYDSGGWIRMEKDTFINYMKSQGKLGGQNKVPRLSNDRHIANELNKWIKR